MLARNTRTLLLPYCFTLTISISLCLAFSFYAATRVAANENIAATIQIKHIVPLTTNDSIWVTTDAAHNFAFTHRVRKGQTLYSIAKCYGITAARLIQLNPIAAGGIQPDMILVIPTSLKSIVRMREKGFPTHSTAGVYFRTTEAASPYHIAKLVFDMPTDSLIKRNYAVTELIPKAIVSTKVLLVGWMPVANFKSGDTTANIATINARLASQGSLYAETAKLSEEYNVQKLGNKAEIKEHGVAFWDTRDGEARRSGLFFVLHNAAPVGSMVKLTNPMNKRVICAKVSGRIPTNGGYPPNTSVVLSPRTAFVLGARDARFHIELCYVPH